MINSMTQRLFEMDSHLQDAVERIKLLEQGHQRMLGRIGLISDEALRTRLSNQSPGSAEFPLRVSELLSHCVHLRLVR